MTTLDELFTLLAAYLDAHDLWRLLTSSRSILSTDHGADIVQMLCTQLASSAAVCNHQTRATGSLATTARRYLECAVPLRWLSQNNICRVLGKYSRAFTIQYEEAGLGSDESESLGTGRENRFYDSLTIVSGRILLAYYEYYQSFSAFDLSTGAILDVDRGEHYNDSVSAYAGHGNLLACTLCHPGLDSDERLVLLRQSDWIADDVEAAVVHANAELLCFELHESFPEHRFTAVALNDVALVAVSQYRHGLFVDEADVAAHEAVQATVQVYIWMLKNGQPGERSSFTLWEASQAELAQHDVVRHVKLVDTYLVVLGEQEVGSVQAEAHGWDDGRIMLQVWDLACGSKVYDKFYDSIDVKSFSAAGEQVPGAGCRLYIAAGGSYGQMLLWRCDTWQFDDEDDYDDDAFEYYDADSTRFDLQEARDAIGQLLPAPADRDERSMQRFADQMERATLVTGVHWDSQKLLVSMGSMLACKRVDTDLNCEHVWSSSVKERGRPHIYGLAACPRFVVLLNSFRLESTNDQIAVLSVVDHPDLSRGHGVAARGANALGYQSDSYSDDEESGEDAGEEGEDSDEGVEEDGADSEDSGE